MGYANTKETKSYMAQENVKDFNKVFYKRALVGRPPKFDNVEKVENDLIEYLKLCDETATVPTVMAAATWLGCDRDTIYNYANNQNSPFFGIFKKLINICHTTLENAAVAGKVQPVTYIFMGKNYFNLRDDKNISVTANTNNDQINSQETMDAIQKQIEEENIPNAEIIDENS